MARVFVRHEWTMQVLVAEQLDSLLGGHGNAEMLVELVIEDVACFLVGGFCSGLLTCPPSFLSKQVLQGSCLVALRVHEQHGVQRVRCLALRAPSPARAALATLRLAF